jgi:hypothetical protein
MALVLRLAALALLVLLTAPARAQQSYTSDLCGDPLPYQASPAVDQRFRLQCTVQKLLAQRADAENRVTAAEVQASVEAAHAKAQSDALDVANSKLKWWTDCAADENCLAWLMPKKKSRADWYEFWKR